MSPEKRSSLVRELHELEALIESPGYKRLIEEVDRMESMDIKIAMDVTQPNPKRDSHAGSYRACRFVKEFSQRQIEAIRRSLKP